MLKTEITLSWNNSPFLADCFTHQTSVIFHLRLLRLELSNTNLGDSFLWEILGPNASWAFTHFLSLCDVLSVISLHWLLQKRGLQQTSRYHSAWFPQQEMHVLGQNAVTSACLPSYRCSSLHPLVYQGVIVWFKTQVEVWALILGGGGLWFSASPTAAHVAVGPVGYHSVQLKDRLLWSWLNTVLMSDRVLWNLREVLTGYRRSVSVFGLK